MIIYSNSNETNLFWLLNGFTIENEEKGNYYFDLLGDSNFDKGLNGCFKGEAYIEKNSEFEKLTRSSEVMLERLLGDKNSKIILNIYSTTDENEKTLKEDFEKLGKIQLLIKFKEKTYDYEKVEIECFDF